MSSGFDQEKFLEDWCGEFARGIEMFSGKQAAAEFAAASSPAAAPAEWKEYLWWKQQFEGTGGGFVTWIGAPEAAWSGLGAAMADAGTDGKQVYLELLGTAEQGAATLLSRQVGQEIRPQTGEQEEPASSPSLNFWEVKVRLTDSELPPLVYAIDPSRVAGLGVSASPAEERPKGFEAAKNEPSYDSRVDQFLNLDLPLSVVLGRSVLQIGEVLKLTSGSVVELDSTVLDRVEVIVHGKLVARGEVVSVKGNYGVRITDIIADKSAWASSFALSGMKQEN